MATEYKRLRSPVGSREGASQSPAGALQRVKFYFSHHRLMAVDSLARLLANLLASLMTWSVIGIALAMLFAYLQVTFKLIPLQGSFVIDYYPVDIFLTDVLLVMLTVFVIALLASWVPSVKAARQKVSLRAQ